MQKILVIGTGGLAREFTEWFGATYQIIGYCSDDLSAHVEYNLIGTHYNSGVTPAEAGTDLAVIAIGDPAIKCKLYEQLTARGFKFPTFVHPTCVVADNVTLAPGVVISPQCCIGPNVTLQTCVYVNFHCGIGHESSVGSFTQINPGAQIGGAAKIGNVVLVGSGATILQGMTVGDHATVASGAVVFSNVAEKSTVIGNPAKRLRTFETEQV
jgi:sugar O-acyltransferase (sialic acid O-acetyltransferase NeuD family)